VYCQCDPLDTTYEKKQEVRHNAAMAHANANASYILLEEGTPASMSASERPTG